VNWQVIGKLHLNTYVHAFFGVLRLPLCTLSAVYISDQSGPSLLADLSKAAYKVPGDSGGADCVQALSEAEKVPKTGLGLKRKRVRSL
jgi:hypothetical protein